MAVSDREHSDAQDAEAAVCEPVCERSPDTASTGQPFEELPEPRPQNRGWFQRGKPGPRLKHGGRSALVHAGRLPEQTEALAMLAEREAVIVADLGGPDAITVLGLDEVRRYARLEVIYEYAVAKVFDGGPFSAKGHTRAVTTLLLQLDDRLERKARALGYIRKPKPAGAALADWLSQRAEAAGQVQPGDADQHVDEHAVDADESLSD